MRPVKTKKSFSMLTRCFHEKYLGIAIAISVFLLFSVSFLVQSNQAAVTQQKKDIYGRHNGCIYDVTEATASALKQHLAITEYGEMTICGEISLGSIGFVDENFIHMEEISFLEGSFPENKDEIAMETVLLDQLHLPYELGQVITLRVQQTDEATSEMFVTEYSWKLCGIMDSYSINWKSSDYPLCSAFVLEGALSDSYSQTHLFFLSAHENEQQMQELQPLITDFKKSELVYNDYSYPEKYFSFLELLQKNTVLLLTAAICVLFLVCVQLGSYRHHMHNMRILQMLGIDRRKLISLLYGRTLQTWVIAYGITICVCSGIVGILVCLKNLSGFSKLQELWPLEQLQQFEQQFCFVLSPVPYFISAAASFLIVLLGKSIQYVILRKIELIPKGRELTVYKPTRISANKKKPVYNRKSFLKREYAQNRKFYCMEFLISLASVVVLAVSMLAISHEIRNYCISDLIGGEEYFWQSNTPKNGLSESDIAKIEKTAGIEQLIYTSEISYSEQEKIFLQYDGAETDPYAAAQNMAYELSAENGLASHIVVIPENSILWDYYLSDEIDQESFLSGESVILYLPDLMKNETYNMYISVNNFQISSVNDTIEERDLLKPQLKQGETVQIIRKGSEESSDTSDIIKNVTVEKILTKFKSKSQTSLDFLLAGTILVSDTLYKELFSLEDCCYNYVQAFGNTDASYDVTDKIMSSITKDTHITFTNNRAETEKKYQSMFVTVFFYSCIAALTCIFALIILYRIRILFLENNRQRMQLLQLLGCDTQTRQKLTLPKMYLFMILISIVFNIVLLFGSWYFTLGWQYQTSNFVNDWIRIIQLGATQFPWGVYMIPQVIYILVYVFTCMRKRYSL